MRFEWDETKSQKNEVKHGISFSEALTLFLGDHVTFEIATTPEKRWAIIGKIKNKFYTSIFTQRKGKFRIISVRRSRKNEEDYYGKYF